MNQEPNGSAQTNSVSNFCQAKLFNQGSGAGGQRSGAGGQELEVRVSDLNRVSD